MLLSKGDLQRVHVLRGVLTSRSPVEAREPLLSAMTKTNAEFMAAMQGR